MQEIMTVLLLMGLCVLFIGVLGVLPSQIAPKGNSNNNAPTENFSRVRDAPLP
jgi:hypothetical protein